MYLLDTDTCIYWRNGTHPNLRERIARTPSSDLGTTAITAGELLFGVEHSTKRPTNREGTEDFLASIEVVPFTVEAARHYATIREDLTRRGALIGSNDLLIAATALAENATLVTNNVSEFSRVNGLRLENWAE